MQREPDRRDQIGDPGQRGEHDRSDDQVGNTPAVSERLRRVDHRRRASDHAGERRHNAERVGKAAEPRVRVEAGVFLLFSHGLAEAGRQPLEPARVQRRQRDVRREDGQQEDERRPRRQSARDEQRADCRDEQHDAAVEDEPVTVNPHRACEDGRQAEQRRDVEHV